jgi:acyl carrier protein
MKPAASLSREVLRELLRLPAEASTAASFDDLDVDSWSLIELRAVLEARYSLSFSDDDWLSISCPEDILVLGSR